MEKINFIITIEAYPPKHAYSKKKLFQDKYAEGEYTSPNVSFLANFWIELKENGCKYHHMGSKIFN